MVQWPNEDCGCTVITCRTSVLCNVEVIEKDGLNFVSLYFKIRTSEKYDLNYISLDVEYQNKGETHAVQQSWTQF